MFSNRKPSYKSIIPFTTWSFSIKISNGQQLCLVFLITLSFINLRKTLNWVSTEERLIIISKTFKHHEQQISPWVMMKWSSSVLGVLVAVHRCGQLVA